MSSTREPSISATNRPQSWILALVHSPIRRPWVNGPCLDRDGKHTERSGKGERRVGASSGRHDPLVIGQRRRGGVMEPRNIENYRAGHEAFNRRDFAAMT